MKALLFTTTVVLSTFTFGQSTLSLHPYPSEGKDAFIASCIPCGYSTNNYGSSNRFSSVAWTNQGANSDGKSLLQFDLSSIPANSVIISAELSLSFNPTDGDGQHSSLTNSNQSYLQRITSSWDEMTVNWVNQPSITTTNQVLLAESNSSTQDYPNIDVANLVQDMVNDPTGSHGFMLSGVSDQHYYRLTFASSDHLDQHLHPKLVIVYESAATTQEAQLINFQLFPNPASETVAIVSEHKIELIEILDMSGRILKIQNGESELVDVNTLVSGNYLVRLTTKNGIGTETLVIH